MRRILLIVALCVLLTGCTGWMDYSYHSVEPHLSEGSQKPEGLVQVADFTQLMDAMAAMVENGEDSAVLAVGDYPQTQLDSGLSRAAKRVMAEEPIAAYAVEDIVWEKGSSGGLDAVLITVTYNHNRGGIPRIRRVQTVDEAMAVISAALDQCQASITVRLDDYAETDFAQLAQDYCAENPQSVMETPQVEVRTYPEKGRERVVELQFTYQTSRETLRTMQTYVRPVFTAAEMYVTEDAADSVKYSQIFGFLMERYEYTIETSITPAYSLLRYGVGDSKAFATVYSEMCRNSGLECLVVSGTGDGEPRYWNIVKVDGVYYHLDLLRSNRRDQLLLLADGDMQGYVWDYSAYPVCGISEETPAQPTQ